MTDPVHNQALDGTSVRGMRPEDRFWLSSAAAVVSVAALGSLLWLLPGSPVTLWRADAALGTQDAGRLGIEADGTRHAPHFAFLPFLS